MGPGQRADLYSSVDVALSLAIMGEDLKTRFSTEERDEWCRHINSFADHDFNSPTDGSYFDRLGHSKLHANGQVIKALGLLGGKLRFPCRLYEPFDSVDKLPGFLDSLRWERCWSQSHQIWGGAFAFSRSAACTEAWRERLFSWLDANAEAQTGWWKKDIPHADRHQGLGGAAHILPIYQHFGRPLPAPQKLLDSTLAMQLPSGRWLQTSNPNPMNYLELDALYVLRLPALKFPATVATIFCLPREGSESSQKLIWRAVSRIRSRSIRTIFWRPLAALVSSIKSFRMNRGMTGLGRTSFPTRGLC